MRPLTGEPIEATARPKSIAVQFEQAGPYAAPLAPRIVALAPAAETPGGDTIRQPAAIAEAIDETPAAPEPQTLVPLEPPSQPAIALPAIAPAERLAEQPPPAATKPAPPPDAPMYAVGQRAIQMADRASAMAERGMLYAARDDLVQALKLLMQALDAEEGTTRHAAALFAGLTALDEARDFAVQTAEPGHASDAASLVAQHRTPVLRDEPASVGISPVIAQQRYFAFAQEQLVAAAGRLPPASQILCRLGRLQTALAAHDADPLVLHAPRAIVFHQAALATDPNNWLAANELGVLYARYGQWQEARQLFVQSVVLHPHAAGWQNLVVAHRRLGETDLAERAEHERKRLVERSAGSAASAVGDMVRWVDPKTFAATSNADSPNPARSHQAVAVAPRPERATQ